jgi:hypothetical protein
LSFNAGFDGNNGRRKCLLSNTAACFQPVCSSKRVSKRDSIGVEAGDGDRAKSRAGGDGEYVSWEWHDS